MSIKLKNILITILVLIVTAAAAEAQTVRIKDIASIEGVRANQLVGYGIIVGLEGTGDSQQTKFTAQSVANLLDAYGISIAADKLKIKNVASVMITATLPPFARAGSTIDVVVSSMGDAKSLQGGTLLQTPLKAANGEVYAVAQGPVSIGGFGAGGGGSSVTKNHPTTGRIPGGALVEKETKTDLAPQDTLDINLNSNDFTTAARVADSVNTKLGGHFASAVDGNAVQVSIPSEYQGNVVPLIAMIESAEVTTDSVAKVVVNERTGTVIIGGQVRISPVAISHGSLSIEITTANAVSQPGPLSKGTTAAVANSTTTATEQPSHLIEIKGGSTIGELVRALNALKVTPRDLIAILQAIKDAGALQAQMEII